MKRVVFALPWVLVALHSGAFGRGVSPYLPLNLEPEIERDIERVLILADKPVMTRPIAAAVVLDALPRACAVDGYLCERVRRYLERYMHNLGVTHASVEGALSSGADRVVPDDHGLTTGSRWEVSAEGYYQPADTLLLSLGGIAYAGRTKPTGSMVSAGWSRAQLDIGYRDHWWSPMTDSSMLISTEAPTMASVTLSNYEPLTRLGLQYELFFTRMSNSDHIEFKGALTSGRPELAGVHLAIEPVSGWSLGLNRLLQFGGGARGGQSISQIFRAFFAPGRYDNTNPNLTLDQELGNQVASITSRFLFQGKTPFAVYFEYAGEDTSRGRSYLLGNVALSGGIQFPQLWKRFDLTYEVSEWQNGWYVHDIYQDGLTNDRDVIGNWFGDQRRFNDGVGGQSHMLRIGWDATFGGKLEVRLRTLANASYSGGDYSRGYDGTLTYSRPLQSLIVGGDLYAGRDVFGAHFARLDGFVRYGGPAEAESGGASPDDETERDADDSAQRFVDAGINANRVLIDQSRTIARLTTHLSIAPHFGVGVRRAVSDRQDLGARLEYDSINGHALLAARALDYRYRFHGPLTANFFLGAARYDLATPAYGMYWGAGTQWRDFLVRGWDLGLDYRNAVKVARDHLLPSDPKGTRPDSFYDITSVSLYVSHRF